MATRRSECLSDNEINGLISDGLSGADLVRFEEHIGECSECRGLVGARAASLVSGDAPATSAEERQRHEAHWVPARDAGEVWGGDRYVVRGEIARGGMGRILEAWDQRHRRPVAIKVLLSGSAALESRFAREVFLTARLQHPSIVALYDTGFLPSGEPFFVMKLVAGRSLAAAAREATTQASRLALLPHLLAVLDALAYAHDQGVIHRDLKPANVLLGAFGETVVIDWGLAKELRASEHSPETIVDSDDETVVESAGELTVAGHAIGTPCYMSPEQARGEAADERADVYALGALLYHVLSGGPPFPPGASRDVVARLLAGPPSPLAERVPGLPPDLVTIVAKAMARTPSERYATAREMADDLRRFTQGSLVAAHAYSRATLLRRWLRRYRTIVAMAAVLVVGIGVTVGLSFRRVLRERDRADREKVVAEDQRRSARAHSDAAETLVEYSVVELRKQLASLGRLDLLSGLGGEVEKYYASLSDLEDASNAAALTRRAEAFGLLGEVAHSMHDLSAALSREEEGIAVLERALAAAPNDRGARQKWIEAKVHLSNVQWELDAVADAIASARDADTAASRLLANDPQSTSLQLLALSTARTLSERLAGSGTPAEMLDATRAVPALLVRLTAAAPADVDLKFELADAYIGLGETEGLYGRDDEMVASEEAGLAVLDQLAALKPDDTRVEDLEGQAIQLASGAEIALGHPAAALDWAKRSLAIREHLVARDPTNEDWARRLGYSLACMAQSLCDLGRTKEAIAYSLRQVNLAEEASKSRAHAGDPAHLGRALSNLAETYEASGDRDAALAAVEKARAIFEPLAQRGPLNWRWLLANTYRASASLELDGHALARALGDATTADSLAAALPSDRDDETLLLQARSRALVGEVRAARGEDAAARPSLSGARTIFDVFWQRDHDRAEWARGAPEVARALAAILVREGDHAGARQELSATLARLQELESSGRLPLVARPLLASVGGDLAKLAP